MCSAFVNRKLPFSRACNVSLDIAVCFSRACKSLAVCVSRLPLATHFPALGACYLFSRVRKPPALRFPRLPASSYTVSGLPTRCWFLLLTLYRHIPAVVTLITPKIAVILTCYSGNCSYVLVSLSFIRSFLLTIVHFAQFLHKLIELL